MVELSLYNFNSAFVKREKQLEAIKLRQQGYSLGEISKAIEVAKSSASLWVRDVKLSQKAQKIIKSKLTLGQQMAVKAHYAITRGKEREAGEYADLVLREINVDKNIAQLVCSLLYACEGSKGLRSTLSFTNSNPDMISLFLKMLREGFDIDERKFHVCVHLHDYHNEEKQLNFWSKTANIPRERFMRPYRKPHTGINKKEGYQGCVCVNYYDSSLRRKLLAIADRFTKNKGL